MKILLKAELNGQGHRGFSPDSHSTGLFIITCGAKGNIISKPVIVFKIFFIGGNRIIFVASVTQKPYLHISIIQEIKDAVKLVIGYYVHKWTVFMRKTKIQNVIYNNYRL